MQNVLYYNASVNYFYKILLLFDACNILYPNVIFFIKKHYYILWIYEQFRLWIAFFRNKRQA